MSTPEEERQRRKTIIMWVIGIIVVALLVLGGWMLYKDHDGVKTGVKKTSFAFGESCRSGSCSVRPEPIVPKYRFKFY
jgi:hypothetical protein